MRRAALALDNARLYEQQREVAVTLQRSLLPRSLPVVDGVALASRYLLGRTARRSAATSTTPSRCRPAGSA